MAAQTFDPARRARHHSRSILTKTLAGVMPMSVFPTDDRKTRSLTLPETLESIRGVDLHLHSTSSDGKLSPTELADLCHARGMTHVALTDHDTLDGVEEARQRCRHHACGFPETERRAG